MDGGTNLVVSTAAADVGDRPVNVPVRGLRVSLQQGNGCHDHSCLAVTALGYIHLGPGLLYRMAAVRRKPLYGCYRLACYFSHCDSAGANGSPVEMDSAGPALLDATTIFCTVELKAVPQGPEQGSVCGCLLYTSDAADE